MGFLDILRGKRKLKQPAADRLFAMSTAYVKLEMEHEMKTAGKAAIVFQPLATADFEEIVSDMEEVLQRHRRGDRHDVSTTDDEFGYRWMVLSDPDIEDLVVGVNAVSDAIQAGGYGDRVLCAVFAFKDARGKRVYWIYNYKRGASTRSCPRAASSSATTSASCGSRPRSAPSCRSSPSSSAGSPSGASRSS